MATTTPILGLSKPVVGADDDVWGGMLNGNMDILDGLVRPVDLNAYLKLAGGTMQGPMALAGNAVLAMQPVPLQQLTSVTGNYVAKAGDTMTGPLVLNGNAAAALNPVPLQQLNTAIGAYLPLVGGIMLGDIVLKGNAAAALNPVPLQQLTTSLAPYLLKSGGAMTGVLTLAADATTGLQATTYQQLTAGLGTKIGDAPADSAYYARRNNAWAVAPGSAITTDAPSDSFAYGRLNAAWSKVLPLAGGVVAGATTINGNVFAATTGHISAPGRTVVPGDAVGAWWQPFEMALGFNSGHIAFNAYIGNPGSPAWKALTAGYAATMYLASGGNFNLTVFPSAAAGATFGGAVGSFDFRSDGSFVANGWITSGTGITAGTDLYVNGRLSINPANSWEWYFRVDTGGNHVYNHRANWYDSWQSSDGLRVWYGPNGGLMTLDGTGSVWVRTNLTAASTVTGAYIHSTGATQTDGDCNANGYMRSLGSRVMSQGTNNPGFCCHYPSVYAAGMFLDGGGSLIFAQMDGGGVPSNQYMFFNTAGNAFFLGSTQTNGNAAVYGQLFPYGGLTSIANKSGFGMFSGGSNSRYMQFEGNAYAVKDDSGNVNYSNYNGGMVYLATGSGWVRVHADGGFMASSGWCGKPGGGAWADSSDARIKRVEGDYTQGLDAILHLRPRIYRFLGNEELDRISPPMPEAVRRRLPKPLEHVPGERDAMAATIPSAHAIVAERGQRFIGLVAQEVEGSMPEMVTLASGTIDGEHVDDIRQLDTGALTMAFINAFKEVDARLRAGGL